MVLAQCEFPCSALNVEVVQSGEKFKQACVIGNNDSLEVANCLQSCLVLSCLVLSGLVLSCLVLSLVLSLVVSLVFHLPFSLCLCLMWRG